MKAPTITDPARRRALGARHLLAPSGRTDDVVAIARSLVALHSSDPVTVYLSVLARMRNPDLEAVTTALYADRSLIRHHAMRTTLWVAPRETTALMHRACTLKIADVQRRRTEKFLADSGLPDPGPWLAAAKDRVSTLLAEQGPMTAREIGTLIPELARPLAMAENKAYGSVQGAHSRVLTGLGYDGIAVRTRPGGTWINAQYAWAKMADWAPDLHTSMHERTVKEAQAELAHLWLTQFGPGTERDLAWWMGWTLGDTRAALAACRAQPVLTRVGPAWISRDDEVSMIDEMYVTEERWVALLPGLDPTVMGWKDRDFYTPAGREAAWDKNGNAGPTIWVDGEVVGAWGQTKDGDIRLHFFADVRPDRRLHVQERAEEVAVWLGDSRISWRFPGAINAHLVTGR